MNHPVFMPLFTDLQAAADADRAAKMAAYMRHRFVFLGIPAPKRRSISQPYLRQLKQQSGSAVDWVFIEACWACDYRELQYVAMDYLLVMKHHCTPDDLPRLMDLVVQRSWWDSIDVLDGVFGQMLLNYPHTKADILHLSCHENFWLRRIAIDCQLGLKHKTDTELLAQVIINNLGNTEFFINKAIGWALREYAKTDSDWVRTFISTHRDNMASLSVKEALKHIGKL